MTLLPRVPAWPCPPVASAGRSSSCLAEMAGVSRGGDSRQCRHELHVFLGILPFVCEACDAPAAGVAPRPALDLPNEDGGTQARRDEARRISVNRKARPLFFRSSAAVRAIDAYLAQRMKRCGRHPDADAPYRGFEPSARLFLNDAGEPYTVPCLDVDGRPRFLCRQMLDTYRKIFKRINLRGLSALVLRRTVAVRLDARGADAGQIGLILGIAEKQAVRQLLPRRPDIAELMTDLYSDFDSLATSLPGPDPRGRTSG